jgi:hypothetical protein
MPAIFTDGPFRFFFYMGDRDEPPHVHVERDNRTAKFWLNPVKLQSTGGLRRHEIRRIERIIEENHTQLMEAWNARFNP